MKILLHLCFANCTFYPLHKLQSEGHEVFGFFYNPNIHPYEEYRKRLEGVKGIEEKLKFRIIYQDKYDLEDFLRSIAFREQERCRICYYLRLKATAQIAKKGKFDAFTSTLLVSKHQKHELIKEIGIAVGKEKGINFYYHDFRPGWAEGRELSQQFGIYRQQYCGCIYSEKERYLKNER
jgi:predicted adenine nucleotide alpha hydrolase (AANH) superfamily ATPase